jgi:hypothetical protein
MIPHRRLVALVMSLGLGLACSAVAQVSPGRAPRPLRTGPGAPGSNAPVPLSPLPEAEALRGTGVLEGVVVNALTGEPINGATVQVHGPGGSFSTATDLTGTFRFSELPAGDWYVQAQRERFSSARSPSRVALADGKTEENVRITLTPQSSVSGSVTDEFGEVLDGCEVQLLARQGHNGRPRLDLRAGAQVDDRGQYRISNVNAGRYLVRARCSMWISAPTPLRPQRVAGPDGGPASEPSLAPQGVAFTPLFHPGVENPSGATLLHVAPGAAMTGIDFRLPQRVVVTVPGVVRLPPGLGARDRVIVQMVPRGAPGEPQIWPPPSFSRSTSGMMKGEFQIPAVPPGTYQLTATARGGQQGGGFAALVPEITIGETPPRPLQITLQPGSTLQVTAEYPSGAARPEGGPPPYLNLLPGEPSSVMNSPMVKQEEGKLTITQIFPGTWRVQTAAPQSDLYVKGIWLGERPLTKPELVVLGPISGTLRVVYGGKAGVLEGVVRSRGSGQPVPSAGIVAIPEDRDGFNSAPRMGGSAPDGRFRLMGLAPGRYRVFATPSMQDLPYDDAEAMARLESSGEVIEAVEDRVVTRDLNVIPMEVLEKVRREAGL